MNGESVIIALFFISVIFVILFGLRKSSSNFLKKAQTFEEQGKYIDALEYYISTRLKRTTLSIPSEEAIIRAWGKHAKPNFCDGKEDVMTYKEFKKAILTLIEKTHDKN